MKTLKPGFSDVERPRHRSWHLILILLAAVTAFASNQYIGSLTVVNNTTLNSSYYALASFLANPGTFTYTNTGITATTAVTLNLQWSIDGTNGFTVASWNPPSTNAGTYIWTPSVSAVTIYQRVQEITTNSVTNALWQN